MTDTRTDIQKLKELVRDVKVAMLTTRDSDGSLRSRPMSTLSVDDDPYLWFFTGKDSPKIAELGNDARVNLGYGDPRGSCYVSVSGRAELVRDREKIRQLWVPEAESWFPEGVDSPDLALLRVEVEQGEFWHLRERSWEHGKLEPGPASARKAG